MPLPDPQHSLGYAAIAWIEHHLVHGPGDVQGQPIELDDELAGYIVEAYRLDDAGRRVYSESFFSRSKGRAKSELAGMLVCWEFIGPARFDHCAAAGESLYCPVCREHYYVFDEGEAVGRAVTYPFIRCMATEEGQAGNTYDNVTTMLADIKDRHGPAFPGIDIGQKAATSTRVFLASGGEIRPSTASAGAKDGGKETFTVFDETHLYNSPELRSMFTTVSRNALKRKSAQPWLLQTSTMYAVGEDSIAEQTHKAHRSGKLKAVLFDHVEAPADLDPDKRADRLKGLKACYGPASAWMGLEDMADSWDDPRTDHSDWLRYWWNRPQAGTSDFVNAAVWDTLARSDEGLRPGEPITLGFDGGRSDDSTALIACRFSDGRLFQVGVWERPKGADREWRVPRAEVDDLVRSTFAAYDVLQMWADPNKWEPYLDAWGAAFPKRVAEEWPTDRGTDKAVRLFLAAVKDGSMSHDGSPELSRHVKNASLVKGRPRPATETGDDVDTLSRHYLTIRKKGQGKIDAAWAASLAFKARGWALEKGMGASNYNVLDFIF